MRKIYLGFGIVVVVVAAVSSSYPHPRSPAAAWSVALRDLSSPQYIVR